EDQDKTDGHDDRQTRLRELQRFELSGPRDAIPVRQSNVPCDPLLRFGNRTAEVAVTDAEFDRHVALAPFVIDVGCTGIERNIGELAQWNISIGTGGGLEADPDGSHGGELVTLFPRAPHGKR